MFQYFLNRLSRREKAQIAGAIRLAEQKTSGEIRVHLSYQKAEDALLEAAQKKFAELKMEATQSRNAVLLYVNPRLKKFAVYGDEGIHQRLGEAYWNELVLTIQKAIRDHNLCFGIVTAVQRIGEALQTEFPHARDDQNELSNDLTESD